MKQAQSMKGVVANFLATYTSRYSDFGGYWVFGVYFHDLADLRLDLLSNVEAGHADPSHPVARMAAAKFQEQMALARIRRTRVQEAWLTVDRLPASTEAEVNGRLSQGALVRFVTGVKMVGGRSFDCERIVFVAPHDPQVERRSTRAI
jgi:hypothetical protein